MATHPTIGVEEEFLLADPASGEPVAVNETVAGHAADRGVKLQLELTSCQVETTTGVIGDSGELFDELRGCAAWRPRPPKNPAPDCWPSGCHPPCRTSSRSPTNRAISRSPTGSG